MDLEFDNYDYYDILNVPPNATQDEIKSSYRKLIRLWHPDKHTSNPELLDFGLSGGLKDLGDQSVPNDLDDSVGKKRDSAFTKIQKAYSVLSDPILRGQYDKYGHEGATLARLIMNEKVTERSVYSIQEDLSETNTPKQELLNFDKDEDYVARRVFLLLRDRYARELKMLPFQVVTNYTFNARSDLFADDTMFRRKPRDGYMGADVLFNKKAFYISGMSLDNSVELLYKKFRFGVSLSSVLSRGTFGNVLGRMYISGELTDNLELQVSADSMDFFSPRLFMMSLKKKFNETFWSTFILTLNNKLNPNLYAIFHKAINKRHSVELTLTNGLFLNYSYLKVLNKYTKVNLKAITTPDNVGLELRFKTLNVFGSTLGALVRLCLVNGLTFEWFFRTLIESSYLGVMKVEYRLCFNNDKVILLLKGMINNSKVNVPILLYKGDTNYSIYLVSSLTFLTLMFPLFWTAAYNVYDNVSNMMKSREFVESGDGVLSKLSSIMSTDEEELYKNPMRNNFYSTFPQFTKATYSYIANSRMNSNGFMGNYGGSGSSRGNGSNSMTGYSETAPNPLYMCRNVEYELRHIKYYQYPPLHRQRFDTDENEEYYHESKKKGKESREEDIDNKDRDNDKDSSGDNNKDSSNNKKENRKGKEDNKYRKDGYSRRELFSDNKSYEEDELDRKVAVDENNKLYNMAKMNYFKELDKKGLVVLLAVYGHPKLVDYLNNNYKSMKFSNKNYSKHEEEMSKLLRKVKIDLEDLDGNEYDEYSNINKDNKDSSKGKDKDKENKKDDNKYVINVTNILMSRVNNSSIYLSSSNKDNLIGFYNPCRSLGVAPRLLVVYKYGNEVRSMVYNNNQSVLIP